MSNKTKQQTTATESKEENLDQFMATLYDVDSVISDQDLKSWYEEIAYKGFNRTQVLAEMRRVLVEVSLIIKIIILVAVRGPQKASQTKLQNGRTLAEMGIRGGGGKNSANLTCGKIGAATADIAAYYLKKLKFPKRLVSVPLPGWLQFPAAGSIKLPSELREQHREFSKAFSAQIGGDFNEQIYSQMEANAYLDSKLRLFE
jgi:hypothetical protein